MVAMLMMMMKTNRQNVNVKMLPSHKNEKSGKQMFKERETKTSTLKKITFEQGGD